MSGERAPLLQLPLALGALGDLGDDSPTPSGLGIQVLPLHIQRLPGPYHLVTEEWGPFDPQRKPPAPNPPLVPVVSPTLWDILSSPLARPCHPCPSLTGLSGSAMEEKVVGILGPWVPIGEKHWSG